MCCSVFHTDNQDYSVQQDTLPHEGVQKNTSRTFIYNMFPIRDAVMAAVMIALLNTLVASSISSARN